VHLVDMDAFYLGGRTVVELASRWNDGITVTLLWEPHGDALTVTVQDEKNREAFELDVAPSVALDAYRHPYAYCGRAPTRVVALPSV
jgi:hypothetical protein